MSRSRSLVGTSGVALVTAALLGLTPMASAEPSSATGGRGGLGPAATAFKAENGALARAVEKASALPDDIEMPASYPHHEELRVYPDNAGDAVDVAAGELIGHDELAPRLNALMAGPDGDKISAQVIGRSIQGRDLYLVTLTAPETVKQTAQQTAWRDKIKNDPVDASTDHALKRGYKTPIWFSANIHGNEWEGTDASMQVIEEILDGTYPGADDLLADNRVYFSLTLNPDGRTIGQRRTAFNLDPNRDMITNTNPEARSYVKTAQAVQPLYASDLHGYTRVLQVEPTGPPHGDNYEYDLFIPEGYALARHVEDKVVAMDIPGNTYYNVATGQVVDANTGPETAHIKIPYRDTPSGWDDYPPIFTAQYSAYLGAVTNTVELPKTRNGAGGMQSAANAVINKAVAKATIEGTIEYFDEQSEEFLANQIEVFRRGVAGEPKVSLTAENIADVPGPDEWKAIWNEPVRGEERDDDQEPVSLPRAYVIPVGDQQRSQSDAEVLVERLLFHGIEVGTLDADTTVGDTTYPRGSYVVDMHQPVRGLANTLLDLGSDISDKVPSMYDISAWSYAYLWGATVDKVGSTTDGPIGATTPISSVAGDADVPVAARHLAFPVAGVSDFQALNALLDDDAAVSLLADGTAVLAGADRDLIEAVSEEFDIDFDAPTADQLAALAAPETKGLQDLTIGYVGEPVSDETVALSQLGFDELKRLSVEELGANANSLKGVDVLWISSSLNFAGRDAAKANLVDWVEAGGGFVGAGADGFGVASALGLVSGDVVAGNGDGNGIVALDTPSDGVLAPFAQDYGFIYPAASFENLGDGVTVEQTYAEDTFLAGHWSSTSATNGPEYAEGKAAAVSATAEAGKTFVFGTEPLFRTHPRGAMGQVARAIFWSSAEGQRVLSPSTTMLRIDKVGRATKNKPAKVELTVRVKVPGLKPNGKVDITDRGVTIKTVKVGASGTKSFAVKLGKGRHVLQAEFRGTKKVAASTSTKFVIKVT